MAKGLSKLEAIQIFQSLGALPNPLGFKLLLHTYHPDRGGNEEIMKKINAAWEILEGPKRKTPDQKKVDSDVAAKSFTNMFGKLTESMEISKLKSEGKK